MKTLNYRIVWLQNLELIYEPDAGNWSSVKTDWND